MTTPEQINTYYDFDPAIVEAVADTAAQQNRYSFGELAAKYGIQDGSQKVMPPGASHPLEVMTLTPQIDHDPSRANVYYTAFGYPVNNNTAMHALRMFGAQPDTQLIVVGNPSSIGSNTGKLSLKESVELYRTKDMAPTAEPVLRYLDQVGVTNTAHLGWSYGADKAAVSIAGSGECRQTVSSGVLIEPASLAKRSLAELVKAFGKSGSTQQAYVKQAGGRPYDEVWAEDSMLKFAAWGAGLARLSNIAIAKAIAHGGFEDRVHTAMARQPDVHMTIGWGTESEITPNDLAAKAAGRLASKFGQDRIRTMELRGMHHAAVDDIDLHAAIMLQGMRR